MSAAELRRAYRDAIAARDEELHCYLTLVENAEGEGVPIALKDVIGTKGVRTTAGSKILDAVSKVSELDLEDVPPTSHPLDVVNVFGADEPRPSLPLDDVFANAPERDGDYFRVPPTGAAEEPSS